MTHSAAHTISKDVLSSIKFGAEVVFFFFGGRMRLLWTGYYLRSTEGKDMSHEFRALQVWCFPCLQNCVPLYLPDVWQRQLHSMTQLDCD